MAAAGNVDPAPTHGNAVTVQAPPAPARRGALHGRRRRPSAAERAATTGILAVGAAVGAAVGGGVGSPGYGRIGAALLVLVLGWAGSRARRWALVVAPAVAAVLSSGWYLLAAVLALALAAVLAVRDLRSRPVGAAIGSTTAVACLGLSDLGLSGLSAAVTLALGTVLFVSAYRTASRRERRTVRRVAAVAVAAAVIGSAAASVAVWLARDDVTAAVDATLDAVAAASDGRTEEAGSGFEDASAAFARAEQQLGRWWALPARVVPVVGSNLAVVDEVARSGRELTTVGRDLVTTVDYERLSRPGGGVDLDVLAAYGAPLDRVGAGLRSAQERLVRVRAPWVVAPLGNRLEELIGKVRNLGDEVSLARTAVDEAPVLLGGSGPRRYLMLLGNPAELRDLGGHLGNWAEVVVDRGTIDVVQVGSPLELSLPGVDDELSVRPGGPPASFLGLQPARFPQNWGGSADAEEVRRLASELFERKTGRPVDGVLYADPVAFDALLGITGPVPVPGLAQQLAPGEGVRFLTRDQYTRFGSEAAADEPVRQLVEDVLDRVATNTLPSPRDLADRFAPVVASGHLRMAVPGGSRLLRRVGLERAVVPPPGGDLLAVLGRNANPSKIDAFLRRDVAYRVRWDPGTGRVRSEVRVRLVNTAPATGLPEVVIGNRNGHRTGTNRTEVAILSPFRLLRVREDGQETDVSPSTEGALNRYSTRLAVGPGEDAVVEFELEGDVTPGAPYRVAVWQQPTVSPGRTTLTVTSTSGRVGDTPGWTRRDADTVTRRVDRRALAVYSVPAS